jgi:hypothetical protein
MGTSASLEFLRRYTDLPALLYLLRQQKITLLDPASWDDTNDSYYLLKYKEKKPVKSVLALCMTEAEESYHHWKIFSQGPAGACIRFDKQSLLADFSKISGLTSREVTYLSIKDLRSSIRPIAVEDLPFLKRASFNAEAEYRVIFESSRKSVKYRDISIRLGSILRITLSPWLNQRLSDSVKKTIRAIPGCEDLEVVRSTMVGNREWKRSGDEAI